MIIIRKAQAYRLGYIPPSIIGKLAGTVGTSISWLAREELNLIGDEPDAVVTRPSPVANAPRASRRQSYGDPH